MKCKTCGEEVDIIEQPYYEIDIYKYNQGTNINYLDEILICKDCFDKLEWLKENKA